MIETKASEARGTIEITAFLVGDLLCGLDNSRIREISGIRTITKVHHAPTEVRGVVNLRGQIMTVIDLGLKFGLEQVEDSRQMRILVVGDGKEDIGLLVDCVEDVLTAERAALEPPPSNIRGVSGRFFQAILKTQEDLVAILDLDHLLQTE